MEIRDFRSLLLAVKKFFPGCGKDSPVSVRLPRNDQSRELIATMLEKKPMSLAQLSKEDLALVDEILDDYRFSVTKVSFEGGRCFLTAGQGTDAKCLHYYKHVNGRECVTLGQILNQLLACSDESGLKTSDFTILVLFGQNTAMELSTDGCETDAKYGGITLEVS